MVHPASNKIQAIPTPNGSPVDPRPTTRRTRRISRIQIAQESVCSLAKDTLPSSSHPIKKFLYAEDQTKKSRFLVFDVVTKTKKRKQEENHHGVVDVRFSNVVLALRRSPEAATIALGRSRGSASSSSSGQRQIAKRHARDVRRILPLQQEPQRGDGTTL